MTQLGLVEMTRKKMRAPLCETMEQPCPFCMERGRIDSAETVGLRILDKLEEELRKVSLPIIARISKERMLFDVRTIDERHFEYINETLRKLCK